ncbi:TPA: hypothetical protein N0F65_001567 [Lagenidium giganteum]|uniref:Ribonuclease n=1 Tax=Lagenidium giganteum TaxID=4803 RepID=A0AAV2YCR3_9STRA|nr:TPA: hypothetical protein N0F65_001567 [Lagenidium giganteum]
MEAEPEAEPVGRTAANKCARNDEKIRPRKVEAATTADGVLFKHGTLARTFESRQVAKGCTRVVGVDEAGRGPLAGPVVAAACYVPLNVTIEGVHDSKKLNEEQREALYEKLVNHPDVEYAVHINSAQRIDEINILQASLESMVKAVEALRVIPDFVFVDGNRMPHGLTMPAETVIKGDSKVYAIAAASIIAKVTRDRLMLEYDEQYPMYNLKQHKGYPTRDHMAAIAKHGPCAIHRMTFAPLKLKEEKKPKAKQTRGKK